MDMFLFYHFRVSVLQTGNPYIKGWSMQQFEKIPFFEERDGVFLLWD
jgi:hypothetical protein